MGSSETEFRRVDRLFLDPLRQSGMRKQRRQSAEQLEAMLGDLRKILSYMSDAGLEALADVVARHAGGEKRNLWPDRVSILNFARAIEEPPLRDSALVVNFMACAKARAFHAEAGIEGAVALRKFLVREHRAPCAYGWTRIREEASDWARKRIQIEAKPEIGIEEAAWLERLEQAGESAMALMFPEDGRE